MRKVVLNKYRNPRMSEMIYVGKGDKVYANHGAEEFGFTVGEQYEIQDISIFDDLVMKNDKSEVDEYSVEYFQQYQPVI
ncbi:hypothetical protein CHH83_19700 [Bacillus sp. 7586-K]|nr:hypothetical protein CHH83_19700 [Bacillus sp. 7586-K]